MNGTRRWGLALSLVTALISGVSVYVNAFAVRAAGDPVVYTTAKNAVAAVLLVAAAAALGSRPSRSLPGAGEARPLPRGRAWAAYAAIAVVGGSVPFALFFTGLATARAPQAALLHKTLVLWVAVLAVVVLRERLRAAHLAAIALLLAGQWWLGGGGLFAPDAGALLILAATLLWSVETVLARRLLGGGAASSWTLGAARMGLGGVLLLGWLAATGRLAALASLSAAAWGWIALTGVLLAGYVATWYAALARAQAADVTAVLVAGAVVTALIDAGVRGAIPASAPALVVLAAGVALVAATMRRRGGAPAAAARG